jgi:glyoxylase I family protein
MVKGIYHININVTNFERSLEFYKRLGFKVVRDLGEGGNKYFERGLKIPHPIGRAALLQVGDERRATRIDLIEWKSPPTEGKPYPHLYHAGMCRLALAVDNLQEMYEDLKNTGVEFFSEPQVITDRKGRTSSFICFYDPDGTVVELIQFPPAELESEEA